jgi:hypothetical protein
VPFLRLTRDRRGFENTFLLHADHPGAKARLLYWYRTAPGIALGRAALDEDAIRTIEENHPDIEFDWPAILALSEVMTPEEEPAFTPIDKKPRGLRRGDRGKGFRGASGQSAEPPYDSVERGEPSEPEVQPSSLEPVEPLESAEQPESPRSGLVDELAGKEIARALRARYAEITAKIDQIDGDRQAWLARAAAINPDTWLTAETVLHGVSNADAAFQKLKRDLEAGQE